MAWAAIWMYKATNNSQYIDEGKNFYKFFELNKRPDEFSYQEKDAGVQVSQIYNKRMFSLKFPKQKNSCNVFSHRQIDF